MALVKVCGLTRLCDVALCLRLGVTYLGAIVDIPRSPRCLTWEQARLLLRAARGRGVAVVESDDVSRVAALASEAGPAAVQLHGGQSTELVERLGASLPASTEIWPVVSLPVEAQEARSELPALIEAAQGLIGAGARRLVLDSKVRGVSGGTGVPMNWEHAARIVATCGVPVLLAGGISPATASEALRVTGAAGVDVSSGVERAPGMKSPRALEELVRAVGGA